MSKFKIRDKVRVKQGSSGTLSVSHIGVVGEVIGVITGERYEYTVTYPGLRIGGALWVFEDELELVVPEKVEETHSPYRKPDDEKVAATVQRILDADSQFELNYKLKRIASLLATNGYLSEN